VLHGKSITICPEAYKKLDKVNNDGSSFDLTLPYGVITAIVRDDCVHDA